MTEIFPHEMKALLGALRRDLHAELEKARQNPHAAAYHGSNARLNVRLLEVLNPRGPGRARHEEVRGAGDAVDPSHDLAPHDLALLCGEYA